MCMYAYMYVLYVHMIIIDKYMHNCVYIYLFIYLSNLLWISTSQSWDRVAAPPSSSTTICKVGGAAT